MRELRNTKIIAVDHGYGNICATAKGYESLAYMSLKRRR